MLSLLIVLLSVLVLALAGTVVYQAFQLRAIERSGQAEKPCGTQTENPEYMLLRKRREKAALLCMDLKRSLTHIHTTTPSAISGLSIERIRLLCTDELKERVNAVSNIFQNSFADQLAQEMDEGDFARLDELLGRLSSITEDVKQTDATLTPLFKSWSGGSTETIDSYAQRLTAVSQQVEELHQQAQALLRAVSEKRGAGETALSVPERLRRVSASVSDPGVRAALTGLETQVRQHYDSLDQQTKTRFESYYLHTLELVLEELGRAERAGEDTDTRVQLGLRVIHVLSNVIDAGQQVQSEISERSLEAEVIALERLAAMHGEDGPGISDYLQ